jgi:hypothetical protein
MWRHMVKLIGWFIVGAAVWFAALWQLNSWI